MDPVSLEIQWRRLVTIMDEVDAALVRTSFSTILGETRDFAVVMLDGQARSVSQSQLSSPAFTCSLPTATRQMLAVWPASGLGPGDVLITNDPWLAHGHLPDLYVVLPVFFERRPVAYLAAAAHISDIGGRLDVFASRDVYEEGLRIPPSKLFLQGKPNSQLFRMLEANVRVPGMVLGDVHAIHGALQLGAARLSELLQDMGPSAYTELCGDILSRSEAAMQEAIRRIPDGVYHGETVADGYDEPVRICLSVAVRQGAMHIDFTGSAMESRTASINCVLNVTHAHTIFPLKCSLVPDVPNNEGLFRPVSVYAEPGSILNARFPAAVRTRTKCSYHIHNALYQALAEVMPGQVQAGSGSFWSLSCHGRDGDGQRVVVHVLPNGGKGAVPTADGLCTTAFPGNGTITPAEIIENGIALRVLRRSLRPDSGGAGEYRGGLGQEIALVALGPVRVGIQPDKMRFPAPGLRGGGPGALGELLVDGRPRAPGVIDLDAGQELLLRIPGGGGCGNPRRRSAAALDHDLAAGYVTDPHAYRPRI